MYDGVRASKVRECVGLFLQRICYIDGDFLERTERSFCLRKPYLEVSFTLLETSLVYQTGVSCGNRLVWQCIMCITYLVVFQPE